MQAFGLTMPNAVGDMLSGVGGFAVATTIFRPWVAGLSRVRIFHPESVLPWQEDFYMGTFAMPLNTPRTSGLGVNVKFLRSSKFYDRPVAGNDLIVQDNVSGWAVDVGMVYNIPMPVRDRVRELSLGMMARNIVGRKRVLNRERTMPAQILLGVAYSFDDFVPRERSVLALNFEQALRGTISGSSGQLRVGFEQWFFSHFSALRLGYAAPLPDHREGLIPASLDPTLDYKPFLLTPSATAGGGIDVYSQRRPVYTMGLTAMLYKYQVDVGVTIPAELRKAKFKPGLPETPILERFDDARAGQEYWLPTDKTRFYFQVTYHFWSQAGSPLARVKVEPLVFIPKRGEVGVFNLEASDKRGIETWELMIKNSARVPVRTYSGKGMPPRRLVWDGLDDRFNLGSKLYVVPNGYDPEEVKEIRPHDFGHVAIVYAGTFYPPKRTIGPVMAALKRLKEFVNGQEWYFHYYGEQENHVRDEAMRNAITEKVLVHGRVARAEVLSAVRGAAVAVVITSVNDGSSVADMGMVPGKIFETLGLRTPILLIAPPSSDAAKVIEESGAGERFNGTDIEGIARFLARLLSKPETDVRPENYAWPVLASKLDRILRGVVAQRITDEERPSLAI